MIRPLAIFGQGTVAADLALRRVLRFRETCGPLVVLDWIGRGAPLITRDNEGKLGKRPVVWCDLANRRQPAALFRMQRSTRCKETFARLLRTWREVSGAAISDDTIVWAADVAFKLSEEGSVGLAALYRRAVRPDVIRWFTGRPLDRDEHRRLIELVAWALHFPSVYACSEGPTSLSLATLVRGLGTVWIELPVEHFEILEHRLLCAMVEAMAWDAVYTAQIAADSRKPETVPTVLQLFPSMASPDLAQRLEETAQWTRHVGVFQLNADRPMDAAARAWLTSGADVWVAGQVGEPSATAHGIWLQHDADRKRIAELRLGDVWARSGATGKAVVVSVKREAPILPVAWRHRLYAGRRRRLLGIRQLSTVVDSLREQHEGPELYERLCDRALLRAAWLKVSSGSQQSHGVDGVTIAAFRTHHEAEIARLTEDLIAGRYRCQPLRRIFIPKSDGQRRPLGIACIRDRVVQTACLALLEPIFEPTFSHASFAFRPRRSAHQAIALARTVIAGGKGWAVIADIERCFDRIDHDVLLDLVGRRVSDPLILALLRQWLTADVLEFRDLLPAELGVPQGDPLSPLLANVYLDPLDKHFEAKGVDFVRYADDIVALVPSEAEAVAALRVLADYLAEPLRLTLKQGKTDYVAVQSGVDFLGFRLRVETIEIQPGKLERVLSSLRDLLVVLGAPSSTFLSRAEALRDFNGLVRGFRNYFGVPGEPGIEAQLHGLDAKADELAEALLPADLRGDPAWMCRERFTRLQLDEMTERAAAELPGRLAQWVYPEERPGAAPAAWMVGSDNAPRFSGVGQPATATARSTDGLHPEEESPGFVEHEGRLYVLAHGAYLAVRGDELLVKKQKAELYRRRLADMKLIFLQGMGTNISVMAALCCAERDIPVVIAPPVGNRMAVLTPLDSARSHLRGRQVLRRNDPDMVAAGLRMLAAKIGNQASVLRYFAKYRRKIDPDAYKRLVTAGHDIRELGAQLVTLDAGAAGVRAMAMGFEGRAAALYWEQLVHLVPDELEFRGRATRGATDPVNQAINYVYGMLYGEVWRALVKAGLDPYFGFMHGSERDQGSLVFDLIEEFRAPFADRLVLAMIGRGMRPQIGSHGLLRTRVRRLLARGFVRSWTKKSRWRGKRITPVAILEHQTGSLAKLILAKGDYQPFRMRW